jgi:hypothetical protein
MLTYTRVTYRDGVEIYRQVVTLDPVDVATKCYAAGLRRQGRDALLELVNKWNKQGLQGGLLHVYTAH